MHEKNHLAVRCLAMPDKPQCSLFPLAWVFPAHGAVGGTSQAHVFSFMDAHAKKVSHADYSPPQELNFMLNSMKPVEPQISQDIHGHEGRDSRCGGFSDNFRHQDLKCASASLQLTDPDCVRFIWVGCWVLGCNTWHAGNACSFHQDLGKQHS